MRGYREEEVDWGSKRAGGRERNTEMKELDTSVGPVPDVALLLK